MKIEKIKEKMKRLLNRIISVALPVSILTMSCGTSALVVRAADSSSVHATGTITYYENGKEVEKKETDMIITPKSGYEVLAMYTYNSNESGILYQNISFYVYDKSNKKSSGLIWMQDHCICEGTYKTYLNGQLKKTYTMSEFCQDSVPPRGGYNENYLVSNFSLSGSVKLFKDSESLQAYVKTGDTSGMIELDKDIDDGVKDSDIGYLHNLQMNQLMSGTQDENGIYERYSDRFTWDDTYPEYDSSYLIEVRGKCVVQTRGFLGLGKVKTYTSDIENIAKDISYNDLEWIVTSNDKYAPFNSFINEHMPTNLVMTGVYGMRDLYFRIYKWSEEDSCYHYGSWVNMHFVDDDVWVSVDGDTTEGDFDENGNFIINPDSDYGTGKKNDVGVGVGDSEEDAKKDNDRRNEEKKNDDGKLDLSNASLTDIWNWFTTSLWNLYNSLGFIPEFFQKIFSFLPSPIYAFLGIGIVIAIVLRVLGR